MISERVIKAFDKKYGEPVGKDDFAYAIANVVAAAHNAIESKETGGPIAHADWAGLENSLSALDVALRECE